MTLSINGKTYEAGELVAYVEKLENETKSLGERCLQLQKDKGELIDRNRELESGCGMCYRKDKENLTKAKEIIGEFIEWANWQGSKCPSFKSIQDEAEKFLIDIEKIKQIILSKK